MEKIKSHNNKDPTELEKLKVYVLDEALLNYYVEKGFTYSSVVYNTKVDRDGDSVSVENLHQMAEHAIGKPVCLDHKIDGVDLAVGKVYNAYVINDELIVDYYVFTLETKFNIDCGKYHNSSVRYMMPEDNVTDVYEISFVLIPAVKDTRVLTEEELRKLKQADIKTKNHDIGGNDTVNIEELTKENEELKAKLADLEKELEEIKNAEFDKEACELIEELVEDEVVKLDPCSDTVKGYMIQEVKSHGIKVEVVDENTENVVKTKSGHPVVVSGIPEAIEAVKTKYFNLGLAGKPKQEDKGNKSKSLSFETGATKETKNTSVKKGFIWEFDN